MTADARPVLNARVNYSYKPGRTPKQVVKAFYTWYLYQMDEEIDSFTTERTTLRKYLTRRLIRQIDKDDVDYAGADPFTQSSVFSQGWVHIIVISGLKVHHATATAFVQFGKSDDPRIALTLVKQDGIWKIDKVKNAAKKTV